LGAVREIAVVAGQKIMEVYQRDFEVTDKQDGSPLTEADEAAHKCIVARLQELTPDIPILSEESAGIDYEQRSSWTCFWLVDPLDGTKEFIKRNGEFTVNIALIDHGKPVMGVVYAPVKDTSYFAAQGLGAYKQIGRNEPVSIKVTDYRGGPAVVVASRSHAGEAVKNFLQRLSSEQGEPKTVSMGSSLKLCLVAEGAADVYPRLGLTSEWDTAASQCVVEVAGGKVTDLQGSNLTYNKSSILNPFFIVSGSGNFDWKAMAKDAT